MSEPEEGVVAIEVAAATGSGRPLMGLRYWNRRKDLLYYQVVRILASGLAEGAESVLDVGSHGSPYLDWFEDIPVRTSLDLVEPYRAEGITSIVTDFLAWQPDRRYDLVLCLQVLEHVTDARSFARKLLASGRVVIISVPYRWRAGSSKNHVQDPVTMQKIAGWFGRKPNYANLVTEPSNGKERLVCVFEEHTRPWTSFAVRDGGRGFRPAQGIPSFGQPPLGIKQSLRALAVAVKRRLAQVRKQLRS